MPEALIAHAALAAAAPPPAHASARSCRVFISFPGDDLLSVAERRRGLPLGNLTSQFFANVYLDALDHWATEVLRAPYLRYVDDFALFADDPEQLQDWRQRLEQFLCGRRLRLHPGKTAVLPCAQAQPFLGFELAPGGKRRLHKANVTRFRHRLEALRQDWKRGAVDDATVREQVQGWVAHARHADTAHLRDTLFKGGWFDRHWSDGSPANAAMP